MCISDLGPCVPFESYGFLSRRGREWCSLQLALAGLSGGFEWAYGNEKQQGGATGGSEGPRELVGVFITSPYVSLDPRCFFGISHPSSEGHNVRAQINYKFKDTDSHWMIIVGQVSS